MHYVNILINGIGDAVLAPFQWENPWPGLIAASCLATVPLMLVFKYCSNERAIRLKKGRLIAHVLELLIYQHDMLVSLGACWRIFVSNLSYMKEFLLPLTLAMIPCTLILIQLSCWFAARPLYVGETALLEVRLRSDQNVMQQDLAIASSSGIAVDTEALRIPAQNEADWRLRATQEGAGWVDVSFGGITTRKDVVSGKRLLKVSDRRTRPNLQEELLHPAEAPFAADSLIERIDIQYPARQLLIGQTEVDWLVAFFVISVVAGLVLKGPMKVTL